MNNVQLKLELLQSLMDIQRDVESVLSRQKACQEHAQTTLRALDLELQEHLKKHDGIHARLKIIREMESID